MVWIFTFKELQWFMKEAKEGDMATKKDLLLAIGRNPILIDK
jgi:hypothetical protein